MKKMILIAGIFLLAALLLAPDNALADAASLSVIAPAAVSQGNTFAVDVNISSVGDLYDFQFDLSFNPAMVQATNILEGAFLSAGGATVFIPGTIDNAAGNVTFNADTLVGAVPGISGNGTLEEFDFSALEPGTGAFAISNVILQDSTGAILDSTTTGGSVTVQGTTAVPEPSGLTMLVVGLLVLRGLRVKRRTGRLARSAL